METCVGGNGMESPVRSNTSGENPAQTDGAAAGTGSGAGLSAQQSVCQETTRQQFEAKSYLERQVEELSCADEDEAQEKVSKRLQLKHERARKKRQVVLCSELYNLGCLVGFGLIISHLQQNFGGEKWMATHKLFSSVGRTTCVPFVAVERLSELVRFSVRPPINAHLRSYPFAGFTFSVLHSGSHGDKSYVALLLEMFHS